MEQLSLDIKDGVATVTLNRPSNLNSLDHATKLGLLSVLINVAQNSQVRAVVLTGTGRGFCVGQDLNELRADLKVDADAAWDTVAAHYSPIVRLLSTMPKPVIAALNGVAAGAGAAFAFACDFRLAASSASINLAFTSIGLGADSGSTWTLPKLVGMARAKSLLMRPRSIDATVALALGLVDEVVEPEELAGRAKALALELAAGPTLAYAAIRQSLAYAASHSLDESLAMEAQMMRRTGTSNDHMTALDAFFSKEKPKFRGIDLAVNL